MFAIFVHCITVYVMITIIVLLLIDTSQSHTFVQKSPKTIKIRNIPYLPSNHLQSNSLTFQSTTFYCTFWHTLKPNSYFRLLQAITWRNVIDSSRCEIVAKNVNVVFGNVCCVMAYKRYNLSLDTIDTTKSFWFSMINLVELLINLFYLDYQLLQ